MVIVECPWCDADAIVGAAADEAFRCEWCGVTAPFATDDLEEVVRAA